MKRLSRSPAPSSSNSASSSRVSSHSVRRERSESLSLLSGSETERESLHSSSLAHEITPDPSPASRPQSRANTVTRQRRLSAPVSPSKAALAQLAANQERPLDSSTVGRRTWRPESRAGDVEVAALAAVANSRRSPSVTRRRQPLPREFRDTTAADSKVRLLMCVPGSSGLTELCSSRYHCHLRLPAGRSALSASRASRRGDLPRRVGRTAHLTTSRSLPVLARSAFPPRGTCRADTRPGGRRRT